MSKLLLLLGVLLLAIGGYLLYSNKDVYFKSEKETKTNENSNNQAPAVLNSEAKNIPQLNLSDYTGLYYKDDISIRVYGRKNKLDFAIVGGPELMHEIYEVTGDTFNLNDNCKVTLETQKFTIKCTESTLDGEYQKADSYDIVSYYTDIIGDPGFINTKYFGEFENASYKIVMYQKNEKIVSVTIINLSDNSIINEYLFYIIEDNHIQFNEDGLTIDITLAEDNSITFTSVSDDALIAALNDNYPKTKVMTMETIVDFKLA